MALKYVNICNTYLDYILYQNCSIIKTHLVIKTIANRKKYKILDDVTLPIM